MRNYILKFMYNNQEYEFELNNESNTELNNTDAQIIIEAIIEKQIKYVEGQYVQGLQLQEIEPEQAKTH